MSGLLKQAIIKKILSAMNPMENFRKAEKYAVTFDPRKSAVHRSAKQALASSGAAKEMLEKLKTVREGSKAFNRMTRDARESLSHMENSLAKATKLNGTPAVPKPDKYGKLVKPRDLDQHNARKRSAASAEQLKGNAKVMGYTGLAGIGLGLAADKVREANNRKS